MNIHEYQAKEVLQPFGVSLSTRRRDHEAVGSRGSGASSSAGRSGW